MLLSNCWTTDRASTFESSILHPIIVFKLKLRASIIFGELAFLTLAFCTGIIIKRWVQHINIQLAKYKKMRDLPFPLYGLLARLMQITNMLFGLYKRIPEYKIRTIADLPSSGSY